MNEHILTLHNISKSFSKKNVLSDLSLKVCSGDFIAITGASGCGKSTLLNIIGLLETADQGMMNHFGMVNVKPFSTRAQKLIKHKIGYLFQNYALLENKTIEQNLNLVFDWNVKKTLRQDVIRKALEQVGLDGQQTKKVCQCSGGEQQRIALARLLIKPCELILADEPTGNLDAENKEIVFSILMNLCKTGKSIIMVTHDLKLAERCPHHYRMSNGKLSSV